LIPGGPQLYGDRKLVQARRLVPAALLVAALAAARPARAHQGYPDIVNATFGVDVTKWAAPQGCQLCHTDSAGGTALRPFGQRLVSTYGLDPNASTEDDNSLHIALTGLKSGDPTLVQDLEKGTDPNADVVNDPLPQYGCSMAPGDAGPARRSEGALVALGLMAAAVSARSRRRPPASL
jgi:MYXO-CTERM domain-containing protein